MPDGIQIVELLVDSSQAVTETDKVLAPLDKVAEAAQRAAEGVDLFGTALDAVGQAGSKLGSEASAAASGVDKLAGAVDTQTETFARTAAEAARAEAALVRQSAATDGTAGATVRLAKTLAELSTAQAEVISRMGSGGPGGLSATQGSAELALLAERTKIVQAAMAALAEEGATTSEVMQRFPAAFGSAASAATALENQLRRLIATYDPVGAAQERMASALAVLTRAQEANLVSSDRAAELQSRIAAAYDTVGQAAAKAAEQQARLENRQLDASAQKLREEYNAQAVAIEKYEARLIELDKLVATGRTTEQVANVEKEKAAALLSSQINALGAHEEAVRKNSGAVRELGEEHQRLGAAGNFNRNSFYELEHVFRAVTDAVGAGIPVMTILRFEIGRIVEALAGVSLMSLIFNPFIIAGAAVAGTFALIASRALEIEDNIRQFGVGARTLGTDSLAAAADLQQMYEKLRDTGVGAKQAKEIIDQLRLNPLINPQAIPQIAEVGTRLSALRTGGLADAAKFTQEYNKAIDGGLESTIKFAASQGLLRDAEAANFLETSRANGVMETQQQLMQLILSRLEPAKNSLTDFNKATIELGKAWNDLRDALSKSDFAAFLIEQLKGVVEGIRTTLKEFEAIYNFVQNIRSLAQGGGSLGPSASAPLPPVSTGAGGDAVERYKSALDLTVGDLTTLDAILREASKALPEGYRVEAISGYRPGATVAGTGKPSLHAEGEALDVQLYGPSGAIKNVGLGPGTPEYETYKQFAIAAYQAAQKIAPGFELGWGGNFRSGVPLDLMHFQRGDEGAGGSLAAQAAASPQVFGVTPGSQAAQKSAIDEAVAASKRRLEIDQAIGIEQQFLRAAEEAHTQALQNNLGKTGEKIVRDQLYNEIIGKNSVDLAHQSQILGDDTNATLAAANASRDGEVASLRAAAARQATIEISRQFATVEGHNPEIIQRTNDLLSKSAADAILVANQRNAAQQSVLFRQQQLADGALKGAAAEHEAQIQTQAAVQTHDALSKAIASGNDERVKEAHAAQEVAEQQIRLNALQQEEIQGGRLLQRGRDQQEIAQLELSMVGNTREEIQRQVIILQAKQNLAERFPEIARGETEQARNVRDQILGQAAAQGDLIVKTAEAERAQQRLNDVFRSIGDTISQTLGQAIEDAFNGRKIEDWGARLKSIIAQIMSEIVQFAFIRPLIGSALGAAGLSQAAQSFGSFGGLAGGGAGIGAAGGGVNIGTALQGVGLAKDLGGGSIFGSGGFSGWINNIGGNLGFGTPVSISAAELQELGFSASAAGSGASGVVPGSLFGSGTLSGALGALGVGVGAGGLLASLTGGNSILGSVGGGVGGLAGGLIAPLLGIGGPIGGIVGGLLGGLGGLFGNNKPSNFSSGDLLDLATGKVSGFQSSGNQQNDATVNQISKALGDFSASVQKLTGGSAAGSLAIQAGTRDGIKIGYSGPLGSFETKAADAQSAINQFELAIAQNLTGVSDTLKTVLAHITDPSQIQAAVTFAATYDNLKKAADSAFSSISTDVKTVGPFAQALDSLNKQFKDLTDQANQFGLSLDPINAGLAEATKRLQQDFGAALDQAINQGSGGDYVNQLIKVGQDFASNTREAIALGLGNDATTGAKISQLEVVQAQQILAPLNAAQLQKVVDTLGQSNPELAAMAQTILNTGVAATGATASLQGTAQALKDLSTGVKSLEDLALSLKTGPLSGLTPAAASSAANAAYQAQYQTVLSAGSAVTGTQLSDLAKLGQGAIEASRTAYGEAPQTADLRRSIIAGLDYVTALTGSSANLTAQAGSATASTLLTGSPAVQAAQLAAALAASSGLTSKVQGFAAGTPSTPAGWILVGERGPELINQSGGAQVIPISSNAAYQWRGPAFAAGTSGDPAMVDELRAMRAELMALRRQTQGGQEAAGKDAQQQVKHLSDINRKAGPGIAAPPRQKLG